MPSIPSTLSILLSGVRAGGAVFGSPRGWEERVARSSWRWVCECIFLFGDQHRHMTDLNGEWVKDRNGSEGRMSDGSR